MKKIAKIIFSISLFVLIFAFFPNKVIAECGTYFGVEPNTCGDPDLPYGTCDAGIEACPFVLCGGPIGQTCCTTQDECDALFPSPTPGGPPLQCDNIPNCSQRIWDSVHGNVCGTVHNCISPYVMCGVSNTCCQTDALCPTPTPIPTGAAPTIPPFQPSTCSITSCEIQNVPGCHDDPDIEGLITGIGCIPTHPLWFVKSFQNILIVLSGGIVFLLMIIGAAFILTSQGQPERIKRGKEIFVGAVTGLILLIFAVFLLRLIVKDILNLL